MNDITIAQTASKFSDCPFCLGDLTGEKGWDCISSIRHFYLSQGLPFPDEFEGFTLSNYAERWKAGEGRKELRDFLLQIGQPVEENYSRRGDLFVFDINRQIFGGISLGNGHISIIFDVGGRVIPVCFFKKYIIGIRRLG